MAPKRDLAGKTDPPVKKSTRKSITIKQKVDIIQWYERGETTSAIRLALGLPESTLRTIRKDKEKILAAFKAGTGSSATRVSSGQSTFMVCLEKMLVTWMDHRKRQGQSVTTDDAQKKALEIYEHLKAKATDPVPEFVASRGWFHNFKARHAFRSIRRSVEAKSADADAAAAFPDELKAVIEGGGGGTCPSRYLIWMRQAFSGRCLNGLTSQRRGSLPQASRHIKTVSPSCWGRT